MKPLLLCICDGFGIAPPSPTNAILSAFTPVFDSLFAKWPHTQLSASGLDVGLPEGQMGNSEVGHTNIGAGRVVYQELTRISKEIADGSFFLNPVLLSAVEHAKTSNTALHLMGLLSDGGVHSHNGHLYALLLLAKQSGLKNVFVHCFLDGRDVPPTSAAEYIEALQQKMRKIGVGHIATVSGRYYAMDRDNRWDRIEKAYNALVLGEGEYIPDPVFALRQGYKNGVNDEFVVPFVCDKTAAIASSDSVIFFNFRPDRARELTRALADPAFSEFKRKRELSALHYVCFTRYDATMPNVQVAFLPQSLKNTFGEVISHAGLCQLRIAETEKYAHVTFFFNGGTEALYKGEDRALIPSPKVATYDLKPEMSAHEVTEELLRRLAQNKYDVIVLNFANCDMVGHTGVFSAAVEAVQVVDECVGKLVTAVQSAGGVCLITADHGNADQMSDAVGGPFTAHTTNLVPFIVVGKQVLLRNGGRLSDIAPTMLALLGLEKPLEMDGESLIINK